LSIEDHLPCERTIGGHILEKQLWLVRRRRETVTALREIEEEGLLRAP
jgi:hypothetical protein